MRKLFYSTIFLLFVASYIFVLQAQTVTFKLSAPADVAVGQQFQVVYSLNAEGRDFSRPTIEGFELLMGPIVSSSSHMTIINGNSEVVKSNSYTYTLMATKEGKFKIPSATVMSDGRKYSSNTAIISVLPEDKTRTNSDQTTSELGKSGTDYFVKAILSKSTVFQQEKVLLTYKLYSRYNFGINNVKFPSFDGFFVQEIDLPRDRQLSLENVNGVNYQTIVLKQYLLYPQQSGKLTIPSANVDCVFRLKNRQKVRSIFDDFFDTYQDVERSISTGASVVQVKPLPINPPHSFSGAVGEFDIASKISREKVQANESVTITVTISGNGNLKLVKEPSYDLPEDFEIFDPKITNNFKPTSSGVTGSKVIEYVFVPRHKGTFTIPPAPYSYFDTKSQSYKTVSLSGYSVVVEGGSAVAGGTVSNYTNQEAVKRLGEDVLYIKSGDLDLISVENHFFGSILYWSLLLIPFVVFSLFVVFNTKRIKENSSIVLSKNKNANKVATRRLKLALQYLKENNDRAYYTEMERALWGYLSDKLIIPIATLNKESVSAELVNRGASEEVVNRVFEIIDSCELAIYSPEQKSDMKKELYDQAISLMGQIESLSSLKAKKIKKVIISLFLVPMFLFSISASASSVDVADLVAAAEKSYAAKDYSKSLEYYEQVVEQKVQSASLYYNMGNAYFKIKEIGKSIQYYEKALLLDPNSSEIKYNLEIAKSYCVDKIDQAPLLFFEQWILFVQNLASSNRWTTISVVSFILLLLMSSLFLFGRTRSIKKISFIASLFCLFLFFISTTFAWRRYVLESSDDTAVIGVSTVTLKSTPDESGSNLFILHEGTKVQLINRIGDWVEVSSLDHNIGWLREECLLPI